MNFFGITLSGADETTEPESLIGFRGRAFDVEWGILASLDRQGKCARHPSIEWIKRLPRTLKLSMHLCGALARSFLKGDDSALLANYRDVWARFARVQINFSGGIGAADIKKLSALFAKNPDKNFIIQVHGRNLEVAEALIGFGTACSVLFDDSGGRGIQPSRWPIGRSEFTGCGYAGGLGPNNVREQAMLIWLSAVGPARSWWLDMESSLRETRDGYDIFNLDACAKVIAEIDEMLAHPGLTQGN
jgi:hypothetical protein